MMLLMTDKLIYNKIILDLVMNLMLSKNNKNALKWLSFMANFHHNVENNKHVNLIRKSLLI